MKHTDGHCFVTGALPPYDYVACVNFEFFFLCHISSKDKSYEYAVNVILEVRDKFQSMGLEYIEK